MNPLLGLFFHWLGGLASGSFYVPFRGVRKWSWEVYWLVNGFFSWIIAPWAAGFFCTNNLLVVLFDAMRTEPTAVFYGFLFGMMWGAGGLTFGLTMRYLGMSLGMAVALSYCTVFGTIMPPVFAGKFRSDILGTDSGVVVLLGLGVCVLGIIIAAIAGTSKEREMSDEAKRAAIKEFSFAKGLLVATFSGIMSAGMSYGMNATQPIADLSVMQGTPVIWSQLPRLCVILAGGFTTNIIWCVYLIKKNNSAGQFLAKKMTDDGKIITDDNADNNDKSETNSAQKRSLRVPMLTNYIFCAMAGITWYLQFFFYSLGETQMGVFNFSSWPLHMASIMIFSSLWGLALGEWRGSSRFTKIVLGVTLLTLIFSTIVIGYGTNIGKVNKERRLVELSQIAELEKDVLVRILDGEFAADGRERDLDGARKHLTALLETAGQIAKFEPKENGKRTIVGLADDLKLVNKLLVDPKDEKLRELLAEPELNWSKMPVKNLDEVIATELAKETAELINDIAKHNPEIANQDEINILQNKIKKLTETINKLKNKISTPQKN
jgi:L-rhamnose-H+ transport protein